MSDLRLSVYFNTRAEVIAFGEKLGRAMKTLHHEGPWFIRLDGDFNSGKSLVALAMDKGFRPTSYPDGLERDVRIETLMSDWFQNNPDSLHTVFKHFGHMVCETRSCFDQELVNFRDKNSQASILIAANLERSMMGNDLDDGLNSDLLDLAMKVEKTGDGFKCKILLLTNNSEIYQALSP